MKIKILKFVVLFLFIAGILLTLIMLFDLAKYDSSYVNRSSLTFSINNLNSRKIKKISKYYDNLYHDINFKISKEYREYWQSEESSMRQNLPKIKVIQGKKNNFISGRKIEEVEKNFSNWPRSHGGFSSMRFSSLNLINKNNIEKLKLAWVFNSKDGKKGIQANPVVYEGLVYLPTPEII